MNDLDKKIEMNDSEQQIDTLDEPISETLVSIFN